jgi:organic hydroperoxide reductase OsmC/OhrA
MTKPAPFPHRYQVRLDGGRLHAPPRAPIELGAPPQFGGSELVWSPEELLVGAVLECLWTTFQAIARREGLEVRGWSGDGVGVLDRAPGVPAFTSIELAVELIVAPGDEERARRVLATAHDRCIISRALRAPVTVEATVRALE